MTIIDGFTITGGRARDFGSGGDGGGLYNANGSPTLRSLTFLNNSAESSGGGLYNDNGNIKTFNLRFEGNIAMGDGGGIFNRVNDLGIDPTFLQVTFVDNFAGEDGGAMRNFTFNIGLSFPTIYNAHFENNIAGNGGGAIANYNNSIRLIDADFVDNQGYDGGAIHNATTGIVNASIRLSRFTGNSAVGRGGAISNYNANSLILNSVIQGNSAFADGGGISNFSVWPRQQEIVGTLITSNKADGDGGGIANHNSATTIINSTIASNHALLTGGGIYFSGDQQHVGTIHNSLIWGNRDAPSELAAFAQIAGFIPPMTYSNMPGITLTNGNSRANPNFIAPANTLDAPITGGDYRVQAGSAAIDSADNSRIPNDQFDIDNDADFAEPLPLTVGETARFIDDPSVTDTGLGTAPIADRGAYEATAVLRASRTAAERSTVASGTATSELVAPSPLTSWQTLQLSTTIEVSTSMSRRLIDEADQTIPGFAAVPLVQGGNIIYTYRQLFNY